LFGGVLVLEFGTAAAMWGAVLGRFELKRAITLGVAVWGSFIIADELFVFYGFAHQHLILLCAHLLSYLVVKNETYQ